CACDCLVFFSSTRRHTRSYGDWSSDVCSSALGYGLDTFYEEPGDADDPLIKFPNVIITPHLGGSPRWNSLDDIEEVIVNLGRLRSEERRVGKGVPVEGVGDTEQNRRAA